MLETVRMKMRFLFFAQKALDLVHAAGHPNAADHSSCRNGAGRSRRAIPPSPTSCTDERSFSFFRRFDLILG